MILTTKQQNNKIVNYINKIIWQTDENIKSEYYI